MVNVLKKILVGVVGVVVVVFFFFMVLKFEGFELVVCLDLIGIIMVCNGDMKDVYVG